MINKIYKTIHNKYSSFFKFIFFLRYLIAIFFVASVLLLFIPQFFDYKKKEDIIKSYLIKNYGLEVTKLKNIKFNSFPIPHLQLNGLEANFILRETKINTDKESFVIKALSNVIDKMDDPLGKKRGSVEK